MATIFSSMGVFFYTVALLLSGLVSIGVLYFFISRNRHRRGAYWMAGIMFAVAGWSFTILAQWLADSAAAKIFWLKAATPAPLAIGVFVLLFVLEYTHKSHWLARKYLPGYWVIPGLVTLLAWTNDWHGLVWRNFPAQPVDRFMLIVFEAGPVYWLMVAYGYGCMLAAVIWLVSYVRTQQGMYRRQGSLLLLCFTVPWLGEIVYNLGILPPSGPEFTVFGLAISAWLMVLILSRFNPLALTPIAVDLVFKKMQQAVVAVDTHNRLVHFNPTARVMFNLSADDIGRPIAATSVPELSLPDEGSCYDELEWPASSDRILGVTASVMTNPKKQVVGGLYVFLDITGTYRLQEKLWQRQLELAVLEELQSTSSDLHLKTGQTLQHITRLSDDAIQLLENNQTATAITTLAQLTEIARNTELGLDQYVHQFSPPEETLPPDFFKALQQYFTLISQIYSLPITFIYPSVPVNELLSPEAQVQLARILQRLLNLLTKQGQVKNVHIVTLRHNDWLETSITHSHRQTIPQTLRQRVVAVGGIIEERGNLEQGSQIVIKIPCIPLAQRQVFAGMRALLVDNHPLLLAGLKEVLAAQGLQVVGTATSGQQALQLARELQPDIILMDVNISGMTGIEATRAIKKAMPEVKVVMLTMSQNKDDLLAALRSGASGYLLKSLALEQFFELLQGVVEGSLPLAPEVVEQLVLDMAQPEDDAAAVGLAQLTGQQLDVLKLVAQGCTYRETGDQLHLSEHTVRYHMEQIRKKLNASKRVEVVAKAIQLGLVEAPVGWADSG